MNVMLISPYFSPAVGGVETHLTDLTNYFEKHKIKTFVRTYKALGVKDRGDTLELGKFVEIHRMPWPDFNLVFKLENYPIFRTLYIGTGLFFDCLFFLFFNARKIDVIQVHGFIAAIFAVVLSKLFGKRLVINTHVGFKFDEDGLMNKIIRRVLLNADKILVLTKGAKYSLVKIGIPPENIDVYHYWVDQTVFDHIPDARKSLGWGKEFTVLFVGRLVEVKGLDTIIKIAPDLKDVKFVIAGSGPLSDKLKTASTKYKNIKFLGKIGNTQLPQLYSASDILLIPSKIIDQTYEEGIPRVMIEALSCGLPVVTTPSGGIPDVFDEKIGKMVGDSVDKIKNAILSFKQDKFALKKAATNCRKFAITNFSEKNAQIITTSLR